MEENDLTDMVVKQALDKQECNKIKLKIKQLLSQIDQEKKGSVKMDVFATILQLHKVTLSQQSLASLKRECSMQGYPNEIRYRDALQRLTLNFEVDEPMMKEWIIRVDREASAYSALATTARALSQTGMAGSQTQKFLRKLNARSALRTINNHDMEAQNAY